MVVKILALIICLGVTALAVWYDRKYPVPRGSECRGCKGELK